MGNHSSSSNSKTFTAADTSEASNALHPAISEADVTSLLYGSGRGIPPGPQSAFSRARLDDELVAKMAESLMCSEPEKLGFVKCIDYPQLPDHVYYEGYFHSCPSDGVVPSLNPRSGQTIDKQAAPNIIRAFFIAFKTKNFDALTSMKQEVKKLSYSPEIDALIDRLLSPELDFLGADLAAQIHFGEAVSESNLGWHMDAFNSCFHIAVTLHGRRALYSRLSTSSGGFNDSLMRAFIQNLSAGDVYISNPHNFSHAVRFPELEESERSIAIQARVLMDRDSYTQLRTLTSSSAGVEHWKSIQAAISETIRGGFEMPSLQEVERELEMLQFIVDL